MSQYIVIVNWRGSDTENATPKLSKVFRITPNRAANVMEDLAQGNPWQFERAISDNQANQAQAYLSQLGFEVELYPVDKDQKSAEVPPEQVSAVPPPLTQPETKGSLFSKFKSVGLSKTQSESKLPVAPEQTEPVSEKEPKKPFFSKPTWIGGGQEMPIEAKSMPEPEAETEHQATEADTKADSNNLADELKLSREFEEIASLLSKVGDSIRSKKEVEEVFSVPTRIEEPPPYKRGYQSEEDEPKKIRTSPIAQLFMLLFIFLILALGAIPYWQGMQIEIKFNQLPVQIAKTGDMVWINSSFTRSWFGSEAENILKFPKQGFTFKMTHRISHGIFFFKELLAGDPKRNVLKILDGKVRPYLGQGILRSKITYVSESSDFNNLPRMQIKTHIKLDGSIAGDFNIPIYKNPPGHPFFLSWQGLKGTARISSDLKNVGIKAETFPLLIKEKQNIFLVNQVKAEINSQKREGIQKISTLNLDIDRFSYRDDKEVASFRNLYFLVNSIESGFDQSITLASTLDTYEDGKKNFGPGTLAMQLRNLNPVIMKSLREQVVLFIRTGGKDDQTVTKIRELLNGLQNKPPQFEISKIELKTPEGMIDGSLIFDYKGVYISPSGFNPLALLNGIAVKGSFGVPAIYLDKEFKTSEDGKKVTRKIPVKDLERQGLITKDGNRYTARVEWEKGMFKLNDKTFNPALN